MDLTSTTFRTFILIALQLIYCSALASAGWCGQGIGAGDFEPKRVIVVASRKIAKSQIIVDPDLHESVINSRGLDENDYPRRTSIIGQQSMYDIIPGQIVQEHLLVPRATNGMKDSAARLFIAPYVQAKRRIAAGKIVASADLVSGTIETTDSSKWAESRASVIGSRVKIAISSGQIITTDVLLRRR